MITEKREKQILRMSFFSGLLFAVAEIYIFDIQPFAICADGCGL